MGFFKSVGNVASSLGNAYAGIYTLGAYTPNGRGWAQGNSPTDALTYAYSGGQLDNMGKRERTNAILGMMPNVARPGAPEYKSLLGENGLLKSQYQLAANPASLDQVRAQGLGTGTSPWAQMMLDKEGANLTQGKANLGAMGASQGIMASRQLGMKGGLRQADMLGLQSRGARMNNAASQNLSQNAAMGRSAIMSQDASNRESALSALPGMELQAVKPQKFNITAALQEKRGQNISDVNKFQNEMSAWAAQGQGNSISKSGKK